MSPNSLEQGLDNISAYFLALMIMNEHTHLITSYSMRFKNLEERNEDSPITEHVVLRTLWVIHEIKGALNIDNRRHHMIFKDLLDKWANVPKPAYSLNKNVIAY